MSRVGTKPIQLPNGVSIEVDPRNYVRVKGPKGVLEVKIARELKLVQEDGGVTVERPDNVRRSRSQHGLARTLIHNCIVGVTEGHSKALEIVGVGYRVQAQGKGLTLSMGFSHPVNVDPVEGIDFELAVDEKTRLQRIVVKGIDKARVGQVAADIRKVRKPEPYKGKGIRYVGEIVRLKAGKRTAAAKK